jgi:regulator of nonsense transcripts 2
MFRQFLILV